MSFDVAAEQWRDESDETARDATKSLANVDNVDSMLQCQYHRQVYDAERFVIADRTASKSNR